MLSKRAKDALDVLRQEAQGNPSAASALASVERSLSGNGGDDRETPGRKQARDITEEGRNNLSSRPGRASGDGPPQAPQRADTKSATDSNSRASSDFMEKMRRRRGTARKG